jgi:hypothetical protein
MREKEVRTTRQQYDTDDETRKEKKMKEEEQGEKRGGERHCGKEFKMEETEGVGKGGRVYEIKEGTVKRKGTREEDRYG